MKQKILIVEDDNALRATLKVELEDRGFEVRDFSETTSIEACLNTWTPIYAVVDLRLGEESGLDAVKMIHTTSPSTKILVLTGYGSIATAVAATKLGASNYLTKPASADKIFAALNSESLEEIPIALPLDPMSLQRHQREYIEYVLAECDGNITQAAKKLGLHRQSLQRMIKKYPPKF